jgi:hypothetical protein
MDELEKTRGRSERRVVWVDRRCGGAVGTLVSSTGVYVSSRGVSAVELPVAFLTADERKRARNDPLHRLCPY